jgi:hypothetical protein
MDRSFDSLSEIVPGKDGWRIKVRILRIWEVPTFLRPDQTNSLEMVLIDDKVCGLFIFLPSFIICTF